MLAFTTLLLVLASFWLTGWIFDMVQTGRINAVDAAEHLGDHLKVCEEPDLLATTGMWGEGSVAIPFDYNQQISIGNVVYPFVTIVLKADRHKFPGNLHFFLDAAQDQSRVLCVTGTIISYGELPAIVVTDPSQMTSGDGTLRSLPLWP